MKEILERASLFLYNRTMIKGILFDFDCTLSKRYEAAYYLFRDMLHEARPEVDENSVEFESMVQRCMIWDEYGSIKKDHVFSLVQKYYVPELDVQEWKERWNEKFGDYQVLMPGVKKTLPLLKEKYKLGVLTNGDAKFQRKKVVNSKIDKYFDVIIATGEYGINKPDPRIYKIAAKQMGLKPKEIAFIGDTFATDIQGAVNAGMMPIWFEYERKCISQYPVKIVHGYDEIRHIFLEDTSWM
jgi:putative hydrolase of the HAD superfamily